MTNRNEKPFTLIYADLYYSKTLRNKIEQAIFGYMINKATYTAKKLSYYGQDVSLNRADAIFCVSQQAIEWEVDRSRMIRLLDKLIKNKMITVRQAKLKLTEQNPKARSVTVINVTNYNKWQNAEVTPDIVDRTVKRTVKRSIKPTLPTVVETTEHSTNTQREKTAEEHTQAMLNTALNPNNRITADTYKAIDQSTLGYSKVGTEMPYDLYTKDSDGSKWQKHKFNDKGMESLT